MKIEKYQVGERILPGNVILFDKYRFPDGGTYLTIIMIIFYMCMYTAAFKIFIWSSPLGIFSRGLF